MHPYKCSRSQKVSPNLWEQVPVTKTTKRSISVSLYRSRPKSSSSFVPFFLLPPAVFSLIQHLTSLQIYYSNFLCTTSSPPPPLLSLPVSLKRTGHSLLWQETIYQRPYLMNLPEGYSLTHPNIHTNTQTHTHTHQMLRHTFLCTWVPENQLELAHQNHIFLDYNSVS